MNEILIRKDGSSAIADAERGGISFELVEAIVLQHLQLREYGFHTAEVTSGAVLCGIKEVLEMGRDPSLYSEKLLAMIGMPSHFGVWKQAANKHGLIVPSSLSTDIELKEEGKEIRGGMGEAIRHDELLLIGNYHDEADSKEMKRFHRWMKQRQARKGKVLRNESEENDFHAANIAIAVGAQVLMLCTAANGFYRDGKKIDKIDIEEIDKMLDKRRKAKNKGKNNDIWTKLEAAKKAAEKGIAVVIGNSREDARRLLEENAGTWVVQ